jgi:hypothetical protein
MVHIEHAGDTVETESVETIFIKPESAVGKKKMKNLKFSVIETPGIPGFVNSTGPVMKILIPCTVESAQPFHLIGHSV